MTKSINPTKLKAAAEHLEWVLKQYPESEDVRSLLSSLMPLIEEAKAGRVLVPVERIPGEYNFADGLYVPYKNPNVGDAYARFATEMEGGLTDEDKEQIARLEAMLEARKRGASS